MCFHCHSVIFSISGRPRNTVPHTRDASLHRTRVLRCSVLMLLYVCRLHSAVRVSSRSRPDHTEASYIVMHRDVLNRDVCPDELL